MNKYILDWINAFSGVATFGTLLFILIKEYRTRKHVQDLTIVATELAAQNNLTKNQLRAQFRPIWNAEIAAKIENHIELQIKNVGHLARIDTIYSSGKRFELSFIPEIYEIAPNAGFSLQLKKQEYLDPLLFKIFIGYSDSLANHYETVFIIDNQNNLVIETVNVVSPKTRVDTTVL